MKMETRRIFIGDLPEIVKESDLSEKFSEYGQVSSVEIKQRKELGPKNHSLFFAFVSLETDDSSLQRCFEDFNNKKWKGQYVELQMAKESFLTRLNKEREEAKSVKADTKIDNSHNGLSRNVSLNSSSSTINQGTNKIDVKMKLKHQDIDNGFDTSEFIVKNNQYSRVPGKLKIESVGNEPVVKIEEGINQGTNKIEVKLRNEEIGNGVDTSEIIIKNNQYRRVPGKLKIESVGKEPIIKIEEAKPKSKDPKRAEADSKRIKSMIEMKKGYQKQKLLIKNALSKIDTKPVNKIVFDDTENPYESESKLDLKRKSLFDDEDSDENVEFNFEVKEQFQGEKGQKLLELQSRYKQDERFALSSKFLEDDEEERSEDDRSRNEAENENDEKQEQLMILEKVLGRKITAKETEDDKKKQKTMLRFDPTHPDHVKYEVKSQEVASKKNRKRKAVEAIENEEIKPIVSKEKFYEVAEDLKSALNAKESFSLLNAFGRIHEKDEDTADKAEGQVQKLQAKSNVKLGENNPFKYDSSDDESEEEKRVESDEKPETVANEETTNVENNLDLGSGRLWTEPFFFRSSDSRLQEGVDFIRKVQAEETTEFSKVRRDLVEIVKAKVKNNQRRNRPFKKKLGGRKMLKIKKAMKR